jgi:Zn-dependent protease
MEEARIPKEETHIITAQRQEPYEYSVSYIPVASPKAGKIWFSNTEIKHLAAAASLVVGIGLSWGLLPGFEGIQEPFTLALFTTLLTASFFIHEIAHKIAAQKTGLWAEFRLTLLGAVLTLFSIVSPFFKIISPGAVMIAGVADKERIGKISIAGPATNIILSTVFFSVAYVIPQQYSPIFLLAAAFNAWIALFNLIPFGILDGLKIFLWDKQIWILAFSTSLVLTIIAYGLII